MPDDYIIPNFQNKTVSYAKTETSSHNVGLKVKTSSDTAWHDPTAAELAMTVTSNGPNSAPGTGKTTGEWVGVEVGPV